MSELVKVPADIVRFLFNFDQGRHVDSFCRNEDKITDQVVISYSQLTVLRSNLFGQFAGRLLDFTPVAARIFVGKPTLCSCGTINR